MPVREHLMWAAAKDLVLSWAMNGDEPEVASTLMLALMGRTMPLNQVAALALEGLPNCSNSPPEEALIAEWRRLATE